MSVSNSPVDGHDLLSIPRRESFGRILGQCRAIPGVSKILRVGRKRFIERIKSPQRQVLIGQILRYGSGRDFQAALGSWARSASVPVEPFFLPTGEITKRCSVIVNTVDRATELEQTLASLKTEWNSADELIVVLGPTGDRSEEIIGRSPVPCQLIRCPERNLAISRNLGLQAASGSFVAFIDDDASPTPGWLDALLQPFEEDPKVGISAGFVLDGEGRHFLNRYVVADTLGRAFWIDDAAPAREKIDRLGPQRAFLTATGCNMAFRRAALESIGGFDPFYRYFLEETDVVWRVISAGFKCAISPTSKVMHRLGSNLARTPSFDPESRSAVVRSQIHYIGKFGKSTFTALEIEACVWERVLLDLEKIAWDCCENTSRNPLCGDLQQRYLSAVAGELRLDSPPDSSSLSPPPRPS
ncbi:MAG: glycosyltransferase [Luteolibacter sp.]|uniref:glycosyltransferase family 2 protein n=1 Tax=Luteolibacter sp. TaxID=1962973 RepID=UPI003267213D